MDSVKELLNQTKGRYIVSIFLWDSHLSVFQKVESIIQGSTEDPPIAQKQITFKVLIDDKKTVMFDIINNPFPVMTWSEVYFDTSVEAEHGLVLIS